MKRLLAVLIVVVVALVGASAATAAPKPKADDGVVLVTSGTYGNTSVGVLDQAAQRDAIAWESANEYGDSNYCPYGPSYHLLQSVTYINGRYYFWMCRYVCVIGYYQQIECWYA